MRKAVSYKLESTPTLSYNCGILASVSAWCLWHWVCPLRWLAPLSGINKLPNLIKFMHWTTHTTFLTWFWLVLNYFCTFTYRSRKFSPEGVWEIILFFFFTGPRGLFSVILLCEIIKFEFFQICACCISFNFNIFFFLHLHRAKNSMMDPQSGNDR